MRFCVRELAAVDLYGRHGTTLRRRLVLVELAVSSLLGLVLGGWLMAVGGLLGWLIGGALVGIGANYVALTLYAVELSRSDRLQAQIAALGELSHALRYYSVAQVRLLVPGLVAVLAITSPRHWAP